MPDIICHWLLGKRLISDEGLLSDYPFLNREAFLWGCQGPDILFYHRNMPWQTGSIRSYGAKIHAGDPVRMLRSLAKVCRYCADRKDAALILSYAMGFCAHYCYDRLGHPLVHYNMELLEKTDERGSRYKYHAVVESNLDIMMLRHDTGRSIADFDLNECLPECKGIDEAAALFYSLLLCDLFGVHTPRKQAMTLAGDFRFGTSLRKDPYHIKMPVARAAEHLLPYVRPEALEGALVTRFYGKTLDTGFDYGNLAHSVWFDPKDRSLRSNMSFYDLTSLAQFESKELIAMFVDHVSTKGSVDFEGFTGGVNFSGLKWDA
jgi:hypothetical protein